MVMSIVAFTFVACDDDDYSFGKPFDKTEGVIGDWSVKSVTLLNEGDEELDITSFFEFSTFGINFKEDNTFSISGSAPDLVGVTAGSWELDNKEAPMSIKLTEGGINSQFVFVAPPREGTNLKIKYERVAGGEVIASYVYELLKK